MSDYPKGSWARWRPFLEISVINLSRCLPMEWAMHRCNTQQPCWWVAMSTQNFAAASKINCNTQWQVIKKIKTGFKYLLANYWRACRYILIKNICPDKIYTDLINCLKQKLFPRFLRECVGDTCYFHIYSGNINSLVKFKFINYWAGSKTNIISIRLDLKWNLVVTNLPSCHSKYN